LRLRELRLGGVLRGGAYASVAMHKLGAGVDRYFPESLAGLAKVILR